MTKTKNRTPATARAAGAVPVVQIHGYELRPGDRIAPSVEELYQPIYEQVNKDEKVFVGERSLGMHLKGKGVKVSTLTECPTLWRTHLHVNRTDCYDNRCKIWVVA